MLGAAATALTAACRRNRATAFPGHALIANAEGRSVAAVDLTTFTLAKRIVLNGAPTQVIALRNRPAALVLTPENGTIHEIDTRQLSLTRSVRIAQSAAMMGTTPDTAQSALFLLDTTANELLKLDPNS